MKKAEISYRAEAKEMERLTKQLERRTKALEKAQAKAEKYGVADWDAETRNAWLATVELDGYMIKNKADIDKNGAWFSLRLAQDSLKETEQAIEKCTARLETKEQVYAEMLEEEKDELKIETREELLKATLEEMQKEWAKDGVKLEGINYGFYGHTPTGKFFSIYRNSYGYTERSLHCFTLKIDGETIFTSGLFWRAYAVVKNS